MTIDPYIPGHGDASYDVAHYDLDLRYSVVANRLDGRARVRVRALERMDRVVLDLLRLRVERVAVAGRVTRWTHSGGKLRVTLARPLDVDGEVIVDVRYSGNPRPADTPWGGIGWEELDDGALVAAQPSGAATWFPCNDAAAKKASFVVKVTTPMPYFALANGALVATTTRGSTRTRTYEQLEPTAPYLMAVHIGRYEQRDLARRPARIGVTAPAHLHAAVDTAFARLPEMMQLFVELFGPYPLSAGYSVVVCDEDLDIPVEAQGLAAYGVNHLAPASERLIAHELAHQWFGNSVTADRWCDIWLHEGFARYAEWLWSEASGGPRVATLARRQHAALRDEPEDLILGDPGPELLFDERVYARGALTVHALRMLVGDDAFFDVVRRFTADHRHATAATDDLRALVAGATSHGVDDLFRKWLWEPELPTLSARR